MSDSWLLIIILLFLLTLFTWSMCQMGYEGYQLQNMQDMCKLECHPSVTLGCYKISYAAWDSEKIFAICAANEEAILREVK